MKSASNPFPLYKLCTPAKNIFRLGTALLLLATLAASPAHAGRDSGGIGDESDIGRDSGGTGRDSGGVGQQLDGDPTNNDRDVVQADGVTAWKGDGDGGPVGRDSGGQSEGSTRDGSPLKKQLSSIDEP